MVVRLFVMSAVLGFAPYQCGARPPDPERRIEETAPDGVYALAERFRETGNTEARRTALEFLRDRYPSSRFAERARVELREMGEPAR